MAQINSYKDINRDYPINLSRDEEEYLGSTLDSNDSYRFDSIGNNMYSNDSKRIKIKNYDLRSSKV
jgi:hypothetical protein